MNYNPTFEVKYAQIEKELLAKIVAFNSDPTNAISGEAIGYNSEEVADICDKLYRDELQNVFFGLEQFNESVLATDMDYLLKKMDLNGAFHQCFEDIKQYAVQRIAMPEMSVGNEFAFYIFSTLFSRHLFADMHKIVCQFLTTNEIQSDDLTDFKSNVFTAFDTIIIA